MILALGPIGDMGVANLTEASGTLTWGTASDWDNAAAEFGVVHENTSNTDYNDAAVIQKGYPTENPLLGTNLVDFWLFHPDSGSTVYSHVSGGNDGTDGTGTIDKGQTGILGTTSWNLDSVDTEYVDVVGSSNSNVEGAGAMSQAIWYYNPGPDGSRDRLWNYAASWGDPITSLEADGSGDIRYRMKDSDNDGDQTIGDQFPTNSWDLYHWTWDGSGMTAYLNATDITANMTVTDQAVDACNGSHEAIGARFDGSNSSDYSNGRFAVVMNWTTALSASEQQQVYDVVAGTSYLETATKSYGSATAPDLQNLVYNLNGQTIDLKVIGSPGTADEEVVTQTLDGASSYSLTWSSTHTDFRLRPELSTTDFTTTPTFSQGELIG